MYAREKVILSYPKMTLVLYKDELYQMLMRDRKLMMLALKRGKHEARAKKSYESRGGRHATHWNR